MRFEEIICISLTFDLYFITHILVNFIRYFASLAATDCDIFQGNTKSWEQVVEASKTTDVNTCLLGKNLKASDGTKLIEVSDIYPKPPGIQCSHNVLKGVPGVSTLTNRLVVVGRVLICLLFRDARKYIMY